MIPRLDSGRFFGTQCEQQIFPALTLTISEYQRGQFLPPHEHARSLLCCVLKGAHSDRVGRCEFERDERSLVWYPTGSVHSERHHAPGQHIHVELTEDFVRRWDLNERLPSEVVDLRAPEGALFKHRLQEEFSASDDVTPLAIEGLVLELTAASVRRARSAGAPAWLSTVDEILRADLRRPPSLSELAAAVGVERSRLTREYRTWCGRTIGQEIRRLKVDAARELLASSELDLALISQKVGFADQSHFTRVFRSLVGTTPGQYRRTSRP